MRSFGFGIVQQYISSDVNVFHVALVLQLQLTTLKKELR